MIPHYLKADKNRLFLFFFAFFSLNLSFYFANLNLPQSPQNYIPIYLLATYLNFLKLYFAIFFCLTPSLKKNKSGIFTLSLILLAVGFWSNFLVVESFQTSSFPLTPVLWLMSSTTTYLAIVFLSGQNFLLKLIIYSLISYSIFALILERKFLVDQNLIFTWIQVTIAYILVLFESLQIFKISHYFLNPPENRN